MRASRVGPFALALALAGCGAPFDGGGGLREPDADRDGMPDVRDCAPGDPAASELWLLYVDADGDGKGAGERVAVCRGAAAPDGYSDVGDDCDDGDAAAFDGWSGYADDDRDGVGAGDWLALCGGRSAPPRPLSTVAGDCAPDDAARWRAHPYLYRDADLDGVTVAREGVLCVGEQVDPGYASVPSGVDCDDADGARWLAMEGYGDSDGDGVGAGATLSFCTAGALPAGNAASGGDCAPEDRLAWRTYAYAFRDRDGDGRTVAEAGELCVGASPPAGHLASGSGADCDDGDGAVWEVRSGYADVDGDGAGAGALEPVCSGAALPTGWAAQAGDCAPEDPLAWRSWAYTQRDADGDLRTVAEAGALCVGAATPAGYGNVASGADCDDGDPSVWAATGGFADEDRDGAGAGALALFCTDGTLPAGWVAAGTDCAPADGAAWRLLAYSLADADADGHTAPVPRGEVCAGDGLPDPWRASASGNDCDDADPLAWRAIVRYPDQDGDGVGATPRRIFCAGADEPAAHSRFGWDVDDADPAVTWDGADEALILTLF